MLVDTRLSKRTKIPLTMTERQRLPVLEPVRPAAVSAKYKSTEPLKTAERALPYGSGIFQLVVLFSTALSMATYGLHNDSFKLTAGVMDHWCRRPDSFANLSVPDWKHLAIPFNDRGEFSQCTVRDPPDAGDAAIVVPCTSWEFDIDQFGNNIVSEWSLVCDRRWLIEVARLVWTFASMVSLPIVGTLADRVGRKTVVFIAIPVVLIAGTGSSVPKDFQFFVAVRTVVLAATSGLVPPMLALFFEVTPGSRIPAYFIMTALLSIVITPTTLFFAQLYRAGWAALQLILMIPTFLLVLLYYSVDESPAWLSAKGQVKEAERAALRAASLNKVPLQLCRDMLAQHQLEAQAGDREAAESCGPCGPRLRVRTFLLAYMWTVLCYAYDTFVVNDGVFVGDTVTATGYVASITALLLTVPCVIRFGFRSTVAASGAVFSASLAVLTVTHRQEQSLARNCLVVLMRVAGATCFTLFVPQSMGAYPVLTHSRGAGLLLAFCRLGDIIGQASTVLLEGRHTDLRLAVAAALTSLYSVGAQILPYEYDWVLQGRSTSGVAFTTTHSEESKHVMQETLVPLPKQPVRREVKSEPDRVSLPPEQYSVHSIQKSLTISLG